MDNYYSVVNTVDNTASKFAIITEADNEFTDVGSATKFNLMPTTYTSVLHVVIDVVDNTVQSGISFDASLMNGGQYYQNTAAVQPLKYADPCVFTNDYTNTFLGTAYGTITYCDAANTPIQNCIVDINTVGTATTNASGDYNYSGITSGTYTITTACTEPYTYSTNVGDVNVVLDHILGTSLTGIYYLAGEVSGDGDINVSDMNLMIDNIIGATSGYPIDDWLFEDQSITITNGVGSVSYLGVMAGDADGSH
jgi:hypothetical protein